MAGLELDFVVYLGDPDDNVEAVDSRALVKDLNNFQARIDSEMPYGALAAKVDGKSALAARADPILPLVTHLLKAVPYVLEGEQESILLSESEHGMTLEGGSDDVIVAFFAGDPFEPDEYLLPQTSMPLKDFGEQMVGIAERLRTILQAAAPELLEADDSFNEFFEVASDAVKKYRLEVEHGIRSA